MSKRNYEYRTLPEVSPSIAVNRDGDVLVNGKIDYSMTTITALDGTRMSVQMFIHRAFPDIPMRYIPTR